MKRVMSLACITGVLVLASGIAGTIEAPTFMTFLSAVQEAEASDACIIAWWGDRAGWVPTAETSRTLQARHEAFEAIFTREPACSGPCTLGYLYFTLNVPAGCDGYYYFYVVGPIEEQLSQLACELGTWEENYSRKGHSILEYNYFYEGAWNVVCGADADSDGCPDSFEQCVGSQAPGRIDSDRDGFGDVCDNCPYDNNTVQTDTDNDGAGDACDNCPAEYNPGQQDCDLDGTGDACDADTIDPDGDGVDAVCDNCPVDINPLQEDADADGIGDACDSCTDTDLDGYGNPGFPASMCPVDNCPMGANPGQEDRNANGVGDACEPYVLPDTGQSMCYHDYWQGTTCPLPGEAFYGQDAQYGVNRQLFSKLADNGTALPDNATAWSMVRDDVTGLEWVHDGNLMASRDPGFDLDGTAGDGQVTWQHALDYVDKLNDEQFLGHNDWRLPTVKELSTLMDSSITYDFIPAVNASYFSGAQASYYWSSTTYGGDPNDAWIVFFNSGGVGYGDKGYGNYVRAVRAGQCGLFENSFVDNHDGTVTDASTGLMWQQATAPGGGGYAWQQALAYCENLSLAGYSDWRLPNRNELQSLVDYSRYEPALDTGFFSDTERPCWSSTTLACYPDDAWRVDFYIGYVGTYVKNGYGYGGFFGYYVRAVRAGQCGALDDVDGDTVCNNVDNCPGEYNARQYDCDNDGIGDACDPDAIDQDGDGMDAVCDNCPSAPNGPDSGTCVKSIGGLLVGTGVTCADNSTCGDGICQRNQQDMDGNGIGDACECYGDISGSAGNPDSKVDAFDLLKMKQEFNRTGCTPETCSADVNADGKVDSFDLLIMKVQFNKTGCP